jgi:hypothetical protein
MATLVYKLLATHPNVGHLRQAGQISDTCFPLNEAALSFLSNKA